MRRVLWAFLFGVAALIVLVATSSAVRYGVEIERPLVEVRGWEPFLTERPQQLSISASDPGTGVSSVRVEVEQQGGTREVAHFEPPAPAHTFAEQVTLSVEALKLQEGPATLVVRVRDRSVWSSQAVFSAPVMVDTVAPTLEVLAAPAGLARGGVGLVVYRAEDPTLAASGVALDGRAHVTGVSAALFDVALFQPGLFAALVSAPPPVAGRREEGRWSLSASDGAGHTTSVRLAIGRSGGDGGSADQRASAGTQNPLRMSSAPQAISEAVTEEQCARLAAAVATDLATILPSSEGGRFQALRAALPNGGRRALTALLSYLLGSGREAELQYIRTRLGAEQVSPRRWSGAMNLGVFSSRAYFGDTITLSDPRGVLASWRVDGEERLPLGDSGAVLAPYSGTVRLAGVVGSLGEVLVIDHGAGVSSVLYSLARRHVFEGVQVRAGQLVAELGASGLHTSEALRMMLLVNGVPVDPLPWRSDDGIGTTIEGTVRGVRSALGVDSQP